MNTAHGLIYSQMNFIPLECFSVFHVHMYKPVLKGSCWNFWVLPHYKLEPGRKNTLQLRDAPLWGSTGWCQSDFDRQELKVFDSNMASSQLNLWSPQFQQSTYSKYSLFSNALFRFYLSEFKRLPGRSYCQQ